MSSCGDFAEVDIDSHDERLELDSEHREKPLEGLRRGGS